MLLRRYEMPWRRPWELLSAIGWVCAVISYLALTPSRVPGPLGMTMLLLCAIYAGRRAYQGLRIIGIRAALSGRAMEIMSTKKLGQITKDPEQGVFGYGFEWQPVDSQGLFELAKGD